MGTHKQQPYSPFGIALKAIREKNSKTQAEVSGAVEIDTDALNSYELGETRPSEDILFLLIQHFNLKGSQAEELWRLAGYIRRGDDEAKFFINDEFGGVKETPDLIGEKDDSKIIYTDMIQVMVNKYGVIMNFMQGASGSNKPLAVSRIGMSKEHAKSIVEVLQQTLKKAEDVEKQIEPKRLPPSTKKS